VKPVRWPHGPRCRICVSLAESSPQRLLQRFDELDGADLVEIRLDALDPEHDLSADLLAELVAAAPVPVGFTLRPCWQGGAYAGDEAARRAVLETAAALHVGFVDIELEAEWAPAFIATSPSPVVVSHHWNEGPAVGLDDKAAQARAMQPAMIKLVSTAATSDDVLPMLRVGRELTAAGQPATCFCMGEPGRASRLLATADGAALIYAALAQGAEVAVGQWPLRTLVDDLRVPDWQPGSELYGLIGDPIGHSLSPAIFNAVFAQRGLAMAYVPLAGADLEAVLRLAQTAGVRGVSVTMPFKADMAARSSEREALVEATGAANTAVCNEEGWSAYNTDGHAVVEALAVVREVPGTRAAVVGAGGAAAAAAAALIAAGATVTLVNRTVARAAQVAERLGGAHGALEVLRDQRFDVVINATPVGMSGTVDADVTPFPVEWLSGDEVVFDMVYRPRHTPLLRQAEARGCTTVEGLEMFVRQAAAQYRLLTGDRGEEPLAIMRGTAERILVHDRAQAQDSTPDGIGKV